MPEICETCNGWGMIKKDGSKIKSFKENGINIIICPFCKGKGQEEEI